MDLVDLNRCHLTNCKLGFCRDPYGSRGSKSKGKQLVSIDMSRDPYGSRGSKLVLQNLFLLLLIVEILMDLVDLNFFNHKKISFQSSRDPYGSRGSK